MKVKILVANSSYSNLIKLSDAQWKLYYYFLTISENNFVYKQEFKVKHCCKVLGITKATYYNCIKALSEYHLIDKNKSGIMINDSLDDLSEIELSVLKTLLYFSKTADLVRTYLTLLKFSDTIMKYFTKKKMIEVLGHSSTHEEYYLMTEKNIKLLQDLKLIDLTIKEENRGNTIYKTYKIDKVYETNDYFKSNKLSDILNNIPNEIKQKYV